MPNTQDRHQRVVKHKSLPGPPPSRVMIDEWIDLRVGDPRQQ